MKRKIALVNQRYGLEVNGGSELLCRQIAEKLTAYYDVEVLTTCALEYTTWDNYYTEGVEIINGVRVRRFKTEKSRNENVFEKKSEEIFIKEKNSIQSELEWIDEQGPYCPQFLEYIQVHSLEYDAIIYMTYLYYLTAKGIVNTPNSQVYLLPTAHDESPIYLKYYQSVFHSAKGFIFCTEEESGIVNSIMDTKHIPSIIAGAGVDVPVGNLPDVRKKFDLCGEYILYAGRIDESKGCGLLFDYFLRYKEDVQSNIKLVLIGKTVMKIPQNSDVISLGFVDEDEKFSLMRESKLLVLASEYESLSMVVLESMSMGTPVLVNGKCEVLKGHCIKSNAGSYFTDYDEFKLQLHKILNDDEYYNTLQSHTKQYVEKNYSWDVILGKINNLLENGWKKEIMNSETLNIEEIMQSIKKEVAETNYSYQVVEFDNMNVKYNVSGNIGKFDMDTFMSNMNYINKIKHISSDVAVIRMPGIKGMIKYVLASFIKRLIGFYVDAVVEEQNHLNSHTVGALNQMRNYILEQHDKKE